MRHTFWDTGWPGASAGKLGLRYAPWDVGWIAMSAVSALAVCSWILLVISSFVHAMLDLHLAIVSVPHHSWPHCYDGSVFEFITQMVRGSNTSDHYIYGCITCACLLSTFHALPRILHGCSGWHPSERAFHRCGSQPLSTSSWRCRSSWALCKSMRPAWSSINPPRGKLCGRGAPEAPI